MTDAAALGTGRRVDTCRAQWTRVRDVRRDNSWFLYWELSTNPEVKVWKVNGRIYWKWLKLNGNRDRFVKRTDLKSVADLIRELNAR